MRSCSVPAARQGCVAQAEQQPPAVACCATPSLLVALLSLAAHLLCGQQQVAVRRERHAVDAPPPRAHPHWQLRRRVCTRRTGACGSTTFILLTRCAMLAVTSAGLPALGVQVRHPHERRRQCRAAIAAAGTLAAFCQTPAVPNSHLAGGRAGAAAGTPAVRPPGLQQTKQSSEAHVQAQPPPNQPAALEADTCGIPWVLLALWPAHRRGHSAQTAPLVARRPAGRLPHRRHHRRRRRRCWCLVPLRSPPARAAGARACSPLSTPAAGHPSGQSQHCKARQAAGWRWLLRGSGG